MLFNSLNFSFWDMLSPHFADHLFTCGSSAPLLYYCEISRPQGPSFIGAKTFSFPCFRWFPPTAFFTRFQLLSHHVLVPERSLVCLEPPSFFPSSVCSLYCFPPDSRWYEGPWVCFLPSFSSPPPTTTKSDFLPRVFPFLGVSSLHASYLDRPILLTPPLPPDSHPRIISGLFF